MNSNKRNGFRKNRIIKDSIESKTLYSILQYAVTANSVEYKHNSQSQGVRRAPRTERIASSLQNDHFETPHTTHREESACFRLAVAAKEESPFRE